MYASRTMIFALKLCTDSANEKYYYLVSMKTKMKIKITCSECTAVKNFKHDRITFET